MVLLTEYIIKIDLFDFLSLKVRADIAIAETTNSTNSHVNTFDARHCTMYMILRVGVLGVTRVLQHAGKYAIYTHLWHAIANPTLNTREMETSATMEATDVGIGASRAPCVPFRVLRYPRRRKRGGCGGKGPDALLKPVSSEHDDCCSSASKPTRRGRFGK